MALPRQSIQGSCFSGHGMPRIKSYLSMSRPKNGSVLSKSSNLTARSMWTRGTSTTVPSASLTETSPLPLLPRSESAYLPRLPATVWRRAKFFDAPESIKILQG
ncbi:hypothetical protein PR002_g33251 [Phytophthora rubi]|uniref:Uncharacterized protein n=1 Tax=Phytophthora rubi TaxID=129364 RepID=A0A6A3G186_9STRA|nr:hypothetical protein PR002_g33251 [Phytophthora rubi]